MENMILSFIADLITGLGGGQQFPGIPLSGNINLGDYAWGSQGLDAIVTQLMNNIEGTGPAPLAEDKLSALTKIQITEEHVHAKLQCSVCWEDFGVGDNVIRLDCEHIYHPDCILPWLKLHGTCPVCRKDLNQPEEMETATSSNPDSINDNVSSQQQQVSSNSNTQSNPRALQDDMEFD
jgi:E3 ubiquitin-protein ligase RNF115/126